MFVWSLGALSQGHQAVPKRRAPYITWLFPSIGGVFAGVLVRRALLFGFYIEPEFYAIGI